MWPIKQDKEIKQEKKKRYFYPFFPHSTWKHGRANSKNLLFQVVQDFLTGFKRYLSCVVFLFKSSMHRLREAHAKTMQVTQAQVFA